MNDDPHARALAHLSSADARMAALILRAGPCGLRPRRGEALGERELFPGLVQAIVGQQLSPKAADTIFARVRALVDELTPTAVLALSDEALRGAGLSGAKTRSVRDLATRVAARTLALDTLHALEDHEIVRALSAVRGIGRWTAEMVMMFELGRLDVLPVGDLGVQKGFQRMFRLKALPKPERMEKLARPFAPFRSIASWYMWRINEEPAAASPAKKTAAKKTAAKKTPAKKTVRRRAGA